MCDYFSKEKKIVEKIKVSLKFDKKNEWVLYTMGNAVALWLRHGATNRKVTGSIPDGVVGIFVRHNPSGRIMALE
jgi:hypothetical protein